MLNMFDYMRIRQVLETIFHDDMDIPLEIIKIIQDYHNDDEFVPKIEYCYDVKVLEKTIRFVIDSAYIFVNGFPVEYTIALYVSEYGCSDIRDYKLKINVKANPQYGKPTERGGYIYRTSNLHEMLQYLKSGKYEEVMAKTVGDVTWGIQKMCTASSKQYLMEDKPKRDPIADLDPDSLMMEPELLWQPMEENKNGENKET